MWIVMERMKSDVHMYVNMYNAYIYPVAHTDRTV